MMEKMMQKLGYIRAERLSIVNSIHARERDAYVERIKELKNKVFELQFELQQLDGVGDD